MSDTNLIERLRRINPVPDEPAPAPIAALLERLDDPQLPAAPARHRLPPIATRPWRRKLALGCTAAAAIVAALVVLLAAPGGGTPNVAAAMYQAMTPGSGVLHMSRLSEKIVGNQTTTSHEQFWSEQNPRRVHIVMSDSEETIESALTTRPLEAAAVVAVQSRCDRAEHPNRGSRAANRLPWMSCASSTARASSHRWASRAPTASQHGCWKSTRPSTADLERQLAPEPDGGGQREHLRAPGNHRIVGRHRTRHARTAGPQEHFLAYEELPAKRPGRTLPRSPSIPCEREERRLSRPRLTRAGSLIAAAAALALILLALVAVLDTRASRTACDGAPKQERWSPPRSRLLSLRVARPRAVPPSGNAPGHNFQRGLLCAQVGRVANGELGQLGLDGAFHDDGRFHALTPNDLPEVRAQGAAADDDCVAPQETFAGEIDGLDRNAVANPQGNTIALSGRREISYGLLGPHALAVTYRSGTRTLTSPVLRGLGAYLIVLQAKSNRYLGSMGAAPGGDYADDLEPAGPTGALVEWRSHTATDDGFARERERGNQTDRPLPSAGTIRSDQNGPPARAESNSARAWGATNKS